MHTKINKGNPLVPVQKREPLDMVVEFLEQHIEEITSVTQWAKKMGYSRSYFSRRIYDIYHDTAISLLHKVKLVAILEEWNRQPLEKAISIAWKTGFKDDKQMGQFLSRNFCIVIAKVRAKATIGFDKKKIMQLKKKDIQSVYAIMAKKYFKL